MVDGLHSYLTRPIPLADDENEASDVFLHDLHTSKTSLVSRSGSGETANGASSRPAISANGQYVAFQSDASNCLCSRRCSPRDLDINLLVDVFVFDRLRGVITRLSEDPAVRLDGAKPVPGH